MAKQYMSEYETFVTTAKYWTESYARGRAPGPFPSTRRRARRASASLRRGLTAPFDARAAGPPTSTR